MSGWKHGRGLCVNAASMRCRRGKLFQPEDGHTLVGVGEIRIGAQLGHGFKQFQHDRIEDGKILAGNEILDDALLFAEREGFSQSMIQRAALAGGAITVDDLQDAHALAFGFPDFVQNHSAGFVEGGEIAFDVAGFKVHGFDCA